jgi:3-oxoadipate enol-lactonase
MPFIELEGLPFYFERLGSGEKLLFIGGTGADLRRPETRLFGPLPRHFELLTYDQRGLGQSYKGDAQPGIAFTMADYADDAARLMQAMGWEQAHVVGVSFGGMVAQELVLRHPAKVRKLILCCTSSGGAGGSSFAYHKLRPMSADEMAALKVKITDIRHDDVWAKEHPDKYRVLHGLAAADPFADEPGHAEGAKRQIAARAGHDSWDRLPSIACPVLVMGGRYDGIVPREVAHNLASRIPGAKFRLFEGGHLFMLDDARAFEEMVVFLNQQ